MRNFLFTILFALSLPGCGALDPMGEAARHEFAWQTHNDPSEVSCIKEKDFTEAQKYGMRLWAQRLKRASEMHVPVDTHEIEQLKEKYNIGWEAWFCQAGNPIGTRNVIQKVYQAWGDVYVRRVSKGN